MGTLINTPEIVESVEESDSVVETNENAANHYIQDSGKRCSIEDDINRLFQGIDIKTSSRDALRKSAMKRPIRPGSSQVSGIGISEPVSLKQALRGLCISQAAETAAMKRLSRSTRSSGVSDSGTIKRLYRAVVVEADGSSVSINVKGKGNLVEFTLVPDPVSSTFSREISKSLENSSKAEPSNSGSNTSYPLNDSMKLKTNLQMEVGSELPKEFEKLKPVESSSVSHSGKKVLPLDESMPSKSNCNSPRLIKPLFRTKSFVKKKAKLESSASSSASTPCMGKSDTDLGPTTNDLGVQTPSDALNHENRGIDKASLESGEVKSSMMEMCSIRPGLSFGCNNRTRSLGTNSDETSRFREKGEFSQSSKSSIGDFSSSPSISGESILSWSSRSGNRAHLSKDLRWEAIRHVQKQQKSVGFKDFKILRRLGLGDIGSVYLAELSDTKCLFALKVMDMDFLTSRKKILRAQTEKEILQMLDHPFLPTLYTHFETEKQSCLVIDYCPGGDLHVLRQKQQGRNFPEQATRFYVAEILLALEYLHMLGVVYRDLKPENILVREDGHIMLTDFDLSLRCAANTMVVLRSSSPPTVEPTKKTHYPCDGSSCIDPFCLQPSWQVPCFTPRLLITSTPPKTRKVKSDPLAQVSPLPQLVVEPTGARSNSFVGTYEYLAPEIIKNDGHGSAVDWWTYGIFLFELLYGKTPFKGPGNDETLANIVSQSLRFPNTPIVSFHARDLIRALLVKEPENRLGSLKGAAEIKHHPFFDGLNWALIRCAVPPELPKFSDIGVGGPQLMGLWKKDGPKQSEVENMGVDDPVFEMF